MLQKCGVFLVESDKKVVWEVEDWPSYKSRKAWKNKRDLPYSGFLSNSSLLSAIVRCLVLRLYFE